MTKMEQDLLKAVGDRKIAMAGATGRLDSGKADMAAYEADLSVAVTELRAKHGYGDIERRMSEASDALERMSDEQLRDGSFLAILAMRALFNADESACEAGRAWLKSEWGVEIYSNSNVKEERFAACFAAYAADVCTEYWWRMSGPEVQEGNGMLCLDQDVTSGWQPSITVCIPDGIREDLDGFLDACRRKTAETAADWAAAYVADHKDDPEKMAALRLALGKN